MKTKKKPLCKVCAGKVLHGNLHCSWQHEAKTEDGARTAVKGLLADGFEQDKDTPNIFRKNGVGVTLERTLHVGLAETIRQHLRVAGVAQGKPGDAVADGAVAGIAAGAKPEAAGVA